jgi:hypothetical protein
MPQPHPKDIPFKSGWQSLTLVERTLFDKIINHYRQASGESHPDVITDGTRQSFVDEVFTWWTTPKHVPDPGTIPPRDPSSTRILAGTWMQTLPASRTERRRRGLPAGADGDVPTLNPHRQAGAEAYLQVRANWARRGGGSTPSSVTGKACWARRDTSNSLWVRR